VSIFGTNGSIDADTKNISTSLFRIAEFVKQRHLGGKTEKDIPHISEFGFAAWNLISSIYESGWDALTANIDSRRRRESMLLLILKFSINFSQLSN